MPKAIGVDPPDFKPHYRILAAQADQVAQIRQAQDLPAGKVLKWKGRSSQRASSKMPAVMEAARPYCRLMSLPGKLHDHEWRKCPSSMEQPPLMEPHPCQPEPRACF
jgi:hypothetical protein